MTDSERRNPYQELMNFIPGTAELPLQSIEFTSQVGTFEIARISLDNDYLHPSFISVLIRTQEAVKGGASSASFSMQKDGTTTGFLFEQDLIPGIDTSVLPRVLRTAEDKEKSIANAVILVDFLRSNLQPQRNDYIEIS